MASNQDRLEQISYTDDGVSQGLHCAIAGRSIGQLFTSQSSYTTRFVNFNPRNQADEPDAFEARALDAFYADSSCRELLRDHAVPGRGGVPLPCAHAHREELPRLPWRACRRDRRDRLCQGRMALGRRGRGYQHRHTARRVHGQREGRRGAGRHLLRRHAGGVPGHHVPGAHLPCHTAAQRDPGGRRAHPDGATWTWSWRTRNRRAR